MYRRTDDVEKLEKQIEDSNSQLLLGLQQIKALSEEKTQREKELQELREAANTIVEMVDPQDDGSESSQSLLERLKEAPQKITGFVSETTKTYVAHTLGLIKSYWPQAKLDVVVTGVSAECSAEKFEEYTEELKPVAVKIVSSLEEE